MMWKSLKFPLTTAQWCRVSTVVVSPTIIRNTYRVNIQSVPTAAQRRRGQMQRTDFTVHHVCVTTELCSTDLLESENSRYSPEKSTDHNDGKECRPDEVCKPQRVSVKRAG